MANIRSINGNPIIATDLDIAAAVKLSALSKVKGLNEYDVVLDKYATFGSSGVVLANKAGMGYVHVSGSEVMGEVLEVSAVYPDTTYNNIVVFVRSDSSAYSVRDNSASKAKRKLVIVPSTNIADIYVNFSYSGNIAELDLSLNHGLAVKRGHVVTPYQPFEYDAVAGTITIQNYGNTEWSAAETAKFAIGVYYDNIVAYPFASSIAAFKRTISNVSSGLFYFDLSTNDFAYQSGFAISDGMTSKVVIAEFYNGIMYPPDAMRTIDNAEKHNGKHVECYGDSLTWYDGQNATWGPYAGEPVIGYESYLRAYCHAAVYNHGTSGQTMPEICNRMVNDSGSRNCDILLLMGGDNDDRRGVSVGTLLPHGSEFDTTTTIGAMQYAIETVLNDNPKVVIAIMTEPMGWKWDSSLGRLARVDEEYPNAIRRVAEHYGLPLLDLWKVSGVNEMTRNQMYLDPPDTENQVYMYHPSNYGWRVISERIVKFVQGL